MEKIIFLPGSNPESHKTGLEETGEIYFVAQNIREFSERAQQNCVPLPELIVCGFGWLKNDFSLQWAMRASGESNRSSEAGKLNFLRAVPVVAVLDRNVSDDGSLDVEKEIEDFRRHMNFIYCLDISGQAEPKNFHRVIKAFDAAAAEGQVTAETFQAALEILPRETALDRSGAEGQRLDSLRA